jgi:methionine-rich copper-binding protein CopC
MRRLLALTFLLVMYALPAGAHSALVSSVPSADATVVDFPMEVVLNFNEELMLVGDQNPNKVEVFDNQGALVSGGTVVKGASIAAPVGITGNGLFNVKYRVVSKDGHVVEGSYSFNVESPIAIASPMPISAPEETPEDGPNLLVRLVQLALLAGLGYVILTSLRKANT